MGVSPVLACRCNACRIVSIKAKLNLHKFKKFVLGSKRSCSAVGLKSFPFCGLQNSQISKWGPHVLKMHTVHVASYNYTGNIDDKVSTEIKWLDENDSGCYPAPLSFLGRIRFKLSGQVAGSF